MGRYVKREGAIYLTGGVHAKDGTTTITSNEAAYNEQTDFLTLTGAVHVEDKDIILDSDYGSYDQSKGVAELWGNVRGRDRARTLKSERVTYDKDAQRAHASGHVVSRDSSESVTLTAERLDYDRTQQVTRATDHPRLVQDAKEGSGPVTLVGDTIVVESKPRVASAIGHVEVVRDSLQATAGHAVFYDKERRGVLSDNPRASTREVDVKGDQLELFTKGKSLDRLLVHGTGTITYVGNTEQPGETSTLTAQEMQVWFSGEKVDSLLATQQAANEYAGMPVPGRRAEMNHSEGDVMRLYFKDKELTSAVITGGAHGWYRGEGALSDSLAVERDKVTYEAGKITFEVPKNRIRLEQDAHLRYEDLALKAPEVLFDSKKQILTASGSPVLEDKADTLRGSRLAYDLSARKGAVFDARTRYQSGWYSGGRIRRLGDNVLDVHDATYTTCSLESPHYAFEATRMKIYLKDKILARPIEFVVRGIPLLALPYWVFPIRDDRHSGLLVPQIQFGFSSGGGGFIRNAGYFWAPNPYMDFTFSGDYYPTLPSWLLAGQARYKVLYKFEGELDGSYTRRIDASNTRAGDFRAHHVQQFDENTSLTAEADFTSSGAYTQDPLTGRPLADRIDRYLISNLTLSHRTPWASFNLFVSRRQDIDASALTSGTVVPRLDEQLPTLSIAFPTKTLGRKGVNGKGAFLPFLASTYYTLNARFVNQYTENLYPVLNDSTHQIVQAESTVARTVYQHQLTLSDNRRLFGFVNMGPTFRATQVVYDHDALGHSFALGTTWGLGASASFTLYGTSHGGIGPVSGFRHVFNPVLSYSYQPRFTGLQARVPTSDSTSVLVDRFQNVGGIGLSAAQQSFLNIGVSNRFEARVKTKKGEKSLSNLLAVNVNTTYDFLHTQNRRPTPWGSIVTSVRVQPPNYVSGDLTLVHDPLYAQAWRSATASLGFHIAGGGASSSYAAIPLAGNEAQTRGPSDPFIPWNLSVSLSSGGGRSLGQPWTHRESANAVLSLNPTRNWALNYYNQVDLSGRKIVAEEYTVTRTLHCWKLQFVRRFSGSTKDYYFRIGIIDRPEFYLDRGTTGLGGLNGLSNVPGFGGLSP